MECGEEGERDRFTGLIAGVRFGAGVGDPFEQRVRVGLEPQCRGVAGGLGRDERQPRAAQCARRAPSAVAQHVQAAVGGDPVEPGAQRRALLERVQRAPGREQRVLHGVLGILERAEHPVAVELQLRTVGLDQLAEGVLVACAGSAERVFAHLTCHDTIFRRSESTGPFRAAPVSQQK
jgi:hypothetical protein